eukprot:TRINITY_DN4610_c0_g1_i6.p1 TRINITY_DN4610_c0_g1~~TRINITY_DN4610_c0_g1_i6.p1  ORF type:complete len:193 (-),score=-20.14 TRINITY_DN4610_c0_g1_i6:154-732(-)
MQSSKANFQKKKKQIFSRNKASFKNAQQLCAKFQEQAKLLKSVVCINSYNHTLPNNFLERDLETQKTIKKLQTQSKKSIKKFVYNKQFISPAFIHIIYSQSNIKYNIYPDIQKCIIHIKSSQKSQHKSYVCQLWQYLLQLCKIKKWKRCKEGKFPKMQPKICQFSCFQQNLIYLINHLIKLNFQIYIRKHKG